MNGPQFGAGSLHRNTRSPAHNTPKANRSCTALDTQAATTPGFEYANYSLGCHVLQTTKGAAGGPGSRRKPPANGVAWGWGWHGMGHGAAWGWHGAAWGWHWHGAAWGWHGPHGHGDKPTGPPGPGPGRAPGPGPLPLALAWLWPAGEPA
jgi:hypothetical protein